MNALKFIRLLFLSAALACGAAVAQDSDFMQYLREASAVAPLRMPGHVTNVIPGNFDGQGKQVVLIRDDQAVICKGPDRKQCVALGQLPTQRTVGVNVGGRTVLLQYEGPNVFQACTVNASGFRTSLDCRTVDATRLSDYGITPAGTAGSLVNGVDGKYLCMQRCSMALDEFGNVPKPKKRTPTWQLKPVIINLERDDDSYGDAFTSFMIGEMDRDCYAGLCESPDWFSDRWNLFPPGPERRQCLDDCLSKKRQADIICGIAAGIGCAIGLVRPGGLPGCAAGGASFGVACGTGTSAGDLFCEWSCYQ